MLSSSLSQLRSLLLTICVVSCALISISADPAPTITSCSIVEKPIGRVITLTGTNFTRTTVLHFNGSPMVYVVDSPTSVIALIPVDAKSGNVELITSGGIASYPVKIKKSPPIPPNNSTTKKLPPVVTSYSFADKQIGKVINIEGKSFWGTRSVKINGVEVEYVADTPTSIIAIIPSNVKMGSIVITTPGGSTTIGDPANNRIINFTDGATMILIPAGEFLMGRSEQENENYRKRDSSYPTPKEEVPQHKIFLDDYYMYMTEVTAAQYRKFCIATYREMPKLAHNWKKWEDDYPIVNVDWKEAKAYADWAGVQLPTEAQWEKAARGTDARKYPWGNEWDSQKCANMSSPRHDIYPVGSFPTGASPYGCLDMVGNASEWCADWYSEDYYTHSPINNPTGPIVMKCHTLRGGSWKGHGPEYSDDNTCGGRAYGPSVQYADVIGFRCSINLAMVNTHIPTISSFAPTSAPVGTEVTIFGTDLAKTINASVNGKPAKITGNTPNTLKITIPEGATTGKITVTTSFGTTTSTEIFLVVFGVKVNPKDGAEMVLVPAGEFIMGSSNEHISTILKSNPVYLLKTFANEMPQHKVYMDPYYIYKNEVTIAQYRKFCVDTNRKMPDIPQFWGFPEETLPIVDISWEDAKAYADWAGVIIPSEAQWEKAARGTDGRIYSWGDNWDNTKCANRSNSTNSSLLCYPYSVGSFTVGASPYGCQDMTGNVGEWCSDWYNPEYYSISPKNNPTGPFSGNFHVTRGGAGNSSLLYLRVATRHLLGTNPHGITTGFRCAYMAPEQYITAPKILDIKPDSGTFGSKVTITGINFNATSEVAFNGVATQITAITSGSITAIVPVGATSGCITVTTDAGTAKSEVFTITIIEKTNPIDDASMVFVPGGSFSMGSIDGVGQINQHPEHEVALTSFWLYKYDVTVAQYRRFCSLTEHPLPIWPVNQTGYKDKTGWTDPAVQQLPIVNVSWYDAIAYTKWAGVALPTEAQWEYAARGPQGRNYPWGGVATKEDERNGWDNTMCANYENSDSYRIWPVGSFPKGASWCNAHDLVGNVTQWCADRYDDYSALKTLNPTGPTTGDTRVVKGTSSAGGHYGYYITCAKRYEYRPEKITSISFRCASAAPDP